MSLEIIIINNVIRIFYVKYWRYIYMIILWKFFVILFCEYFKECIGGRD